MPKNTKIVLSVKDRRQVSSNLVASKSYHTNVIIKLHQFLISSSIFVWTGERVGGGRPPRVTSSRWRHPDESK